MIFIAVCIRPTNFDNTKKHPVIVYWYGGSHAQLITNSWNAGAGDYWFRYMAQQGYVVLTIDTRGSDNRGKAFEQSMFRKVGDVQMEDMMKAVDHLKGLPYVDSSNMAYLAGVLVVLTLLILWSAILVSLKLRCRWCGNQLEIL
jgi:dipeptidyl aminopeptidase/acylaminoacyl peptidase